MTLGTFVYAAWLIGLVALMLPNDKAFTALRIVAPLPILGIAGSAIATSSAVVVLAAVHATFATVFALGAPTADVCAQAQAYGDEIRRPLRTPPLFCLFTTGAVALVVAGMTCGPLLIASGHVIVGAITTVAGLPIAFVLIRSIHSLSKRFYVFVPAGLVIADTLVLADPVLLPSERIESFATFDGSTQPDLQHTIDTRMGAFIGSIAVKLTEAGSFALRDGRHSLQSREATTVMFTPLRARDFLALASPPAANPHLHAH
jgi:hypothetical protein